MRADDERAERAESYGAMVRVESAGEESLTDQSTQARAHTHTHFAYISHSSKFVNLHHVGDLLAHLPIAIAAVLAGDWARLAAQRRRFALSRS